MVTDEGLKCDTDAAEFLSVQVVLSVPTRTNHKENLPVPVLQLLYVQLPNLPILYITVVQTGSHSWSMAVSL